MNCVFAVRMLALVILVVLPLGAQDTPAGARPTQGAVPPVVKNTSRALGALFSGPVHLMVGGVAAGGGLAGGLGIDIATPEPWVAKIKALYSIREYWVVETSARYAGRRAMVEGYGRARDLPQVAFYGLGAASDVDDRTNFAMREDLVGLNASFRLAPWVTVGGRAEQLWVDVNAGRAKNRRSIEQVFDEQDAPGLTQQPRFGRYQGSLELGIPASVGEAFFQGLKTRATYSRWVDHELDRFSFTRVDFEAQQRFAVLRPKHRLTLHALVSTSVADAGQEVPFYLQRTLGGRAQLRSVHEDLLGSDGTSATLRGYDAFRFRGRHLLLMQAEYRIPIWTFFDATVFYEAGKVTDQRAQLDVSNLKRNYGFSVSAMRGALTAARVDIGFGGDGLQFLFTIGSK